MLEAGTVLGPYEILSPIGAGGMGEVYKAKDTRLDRIVAIKVLPSHLSSDAGLRERFEREARAVSSLNHPHICTLHDVGSVDGVDFLVMEYMEGETLGERLQKGPLPLDDALRYGIQISDALDKAHREGVVHRDLKPGNIMLTAAGAKLLDFGLAKHAARQATHDSSLSALPTEAQPLTREGAIIGTFQYMAPEQLEGQEADPRSDIFALGAVLYEMLTGQKAFTGKSQASLISAIMTGEPPAMAALQPMMPASLDHVVRRCLAKSSDKRWQSAADVARELEWVGESKGLPAAAGPSSERRIGTVALPLAAALVVGAALATWWSGRNEAPRGPVQRYEIPLPAGQELTRHGRHALALSPDGKYLVYNANNQLHLRPLNDLESRPISGTERASHPFFSPDSQWIGFWAGGTLQRVSVNGGAPVTLCAAENPYGASWADDDTIVFGQGFDGIYRVAGAGGQPEQIVTLDSGQIAHGPLVLPGGRALLYNIGTTDWDEGSNIMIHDLETSESRVLIEGGSDVRFVPTGHLVYALENTILAIPFDLDSLEVVGGPVSIVERVMRSGNTSNGPTGAAHFIFSDLGTLAFLTGTQASNRLAWADRSGRVDPLPLVDGNYAAPALSPEGKQLVVSIIDADGSNLWVYDVEREALSKLTFAGADAFPVWSPDGRRIAYSSGSPWNVFSIVADGSQPPERLTTYDDIHIPTSWSADGQVLAVQEYNGPNGGLYILPMNDGETLEPFLDSEFVEREARFSPDNHWIAYRSDESGRDEVYVRSYPEGTGRQQISTNGGAQPMWNPKGGELFYKEGDRMMVVDIQTGPTFRASKPRILFESRFPERVPGDPERFAVTPDGGRFVVTIPTEDAGSNTTKFQIVVNWFDELRERVPVGN